MSGPAKPDGIRRSAGIKLTIVARQMGRQFDQAIEATGLSRAKFGVIAIVARRPGATQRMIAELLEVTEVTAGRLIERLCVDGYLERRPDPVDRRAHRVHLTDRTAPVLAHIGAVATEHEDRVFAGFSDEDLATLEGLLDRVAGNISSLKGGAPTIEEPPAKPAKARAPRLEKTTGA